MANKKRKKINKKPQKRIITPGAVKVSGWRRFGIVLCSILVLTCVGVDVWWGYLHKYGKDKIISNTVEVGVQTIENGDRKYFMELNYLSNANKNGLEMFEVKYNYILDENATAFYSQGMQYIANSDTASINWRYSHDPESRLKTGGKSGWPVAERYYAYSGLWGMGNGATAYNYASGDDYVNDTHISTNKLGIDSSFKLTLGEGESQQIYLMKFRNIENQTREWFGMSTTVPSYIRNDQNFVDRSRGDHHYVGLWGAWDYNSYYSLFETNYMARLLFNSIKTMENGKNQAIIFEFGDIFNYYKYENGVYNDIAANTGDTNKIIQETKSYYSVKVNVSADGARNAATDSIFHCIHGKRNYNTTANVSDGDYFIGRTVKNITQNDFTPVQMPGTNAFKLKLSDKFVNAFSKFKDQLVLDVVIDLDVFDASSSTFAGLADNAFGVFTVERVVTHQTINGQVITEVII